MSFSKFKFFIYLTFFLLVVFELHHSIDFMDSDELKHYNEKLRKLSFQIEGYLQKSKDSADAVEPDKGLGRLSRMEAMQDQQMVLELRRRKKRQLLEVGNAISRIEQNSYGYCIFCAKLISRDRLDAFPEVQTCVNCA